jgi:pimeloyl-ACP methyl ester carboxylesterase
MKMLNRIILGFVFIIISSCSSSVKISHPELLSHMLALDRHGKKDCSIIVMPSANANIYNDDINCSIDGNDPDNKIDKHITRIIAGLESAILNNDKVELMIIVHGGMVSKKDAAKHAAEVLDKIQADNEKRKKSVPFIYPIFINWESDMTNSYLDHLYRIRQGRETNFWGPVSSPLYLIADVGRALFRAPITYGYQGYNAIKHTDVLSDQKIEAVNKKFYGNTPQNGHGIWLGTDNTSDFEKGIEKSTYLFPGFLKLITTPMLDTIGKSSWDNMLRRTKVLFRSPSDYSTKQNKLAHFTMEQSNEEFTSADYKSKPPFEYSDSKGGLSRLMQALRLLKKYQRDSNKEDKNKLSVTLIGHSMGTIVMSELLQRFSDDKKDLIYNNIVYMAAACTVRDFENTLIPYLVKHKDTNFYNLTLHPIAEENENFFLDTIPRGSLLVWIDDFASTPATIMDLTLGRWSNAITAWPFIPIDIRRRITLKAFGIEDPFTNRGKGYKIPQKHGEFNDTSTHFWGPEYWHVP